MLSSFDINNFPSNSQVTVLVEKQKSKHHNLNVNKKKQNQSFYLKKKLIRIKPKINLHSNYVALLENFNQIVLIKNFHHFLADSHYENEEEEHNKFKLILTSDKFQEIYCFEFDPTGNPILAVGTDNGVCLFKNLNVETFLACGTTDGTTVLIWDVNKEESLYLKPYGGKATALLAWSPDGRYLIQATTKGVIRLYTTKNWEFVSIIPNAADLYWTKDSSSFIFSQEFSSSLFGIQMDSENLEKFKELSPVSFSEQVIHYTDRVINKSKTDISGEKDEVTIDSVTESLVSIPEKVFGIISNFCFDYKEKRLSICFEGESNLTAVFEVLVIGLMKFKFIGFIRSPPSVINSNREDYFLSKKTCSFGRLWNHNGGFDENGSMLIISEKDGLVNFIPCYY
ncbi:hypothetical protein HK099_004147 [Clydaea vesicula]|uniref:Uncharacterized protein n=1 Tax=Clydaea vesicula TaxID=447962 RepID=A0AAD5XZS7_9FUNG|nr:hypothetical protein HK099_004147 [Clydaea vesicula]